MNSHRIIGGFPSSVVNVTEDRVGVRVRNPSVKVLDLHGGSRSTNLTTVRMSDKQSDAFYVYYLRRVCGTVPIGKTRAGRNFGVRAPSVESSLPARDVR